MVAVAAAPQGGEPQGRDEALYSGTANGGANPLRVFGTFKPSAHDCFRGCTLMDGATISVRLGDGRFPGGKVISWEAGSAPGNVDTLKFTSVGGERKRHFAVKDDGLYAHVGFVLVIR